MNAAQILYSAMPELPGAIFFRCDKLSATLRPAACAERHREALATGYGLHSACRRCPIGARHLREVMGDTCEGPDTMPVPSTLCARCGRTDQRLVGRQICVSCYNREREALRGRNARGTQPSTFRTLTMRRVGVLASNGQLRWLTTTGQNEIEPLVRSARHLPQAKFHSRQPGKITWSMTRQTFEYRDDRDRPLVEEFSRDGSSTFRPAGADETPAKVVGLGVELHPSTLASWLSMTQEDAEVIDSEWRLQAFRCGDCERGVLQARKRANHLIQCRCQSCGAQS